MAIGVRLFWLPGKVDIIGTGMLMHPQPTNTGLTYAHLYTKCQRNPENEGW